MRNTLSIIGCLAYALFVQTHLINHQKNLVLELQAPVYNYLKYQVRESSHEERQGETDGDTAPVELVLIPTLLFFWLNAVCFMIGSIGS